MYEWTTTKLLEIRQQSTKFLIDALEPMYINFEFQLGSSKNTTCWSRNEIKNKFNEYEQINFAKNKTKYWIYGNSV